MIPAWHSLDSVGGLCFDILSPLPLTWMNVAYRICPGRHLADQSLFEVIASTLCVFSVALPLDEQGNPMPLTGEMSNGMIT